MWVAANPRFKSINVYDGNRQLVKEFTTAFQSATEIPLQKDSPGSQINNQLKREKDDSGSGADYR